MTWNACTDDDFSSYQLYRSTTSANFTPDSSTRINRGGEESQRDKTRYRDAGLSPLTTYYYALVTAHGGTTTTSRKTITTPDKPPFEVTFADDQLARSCAGGIGVDGVHDFSIVGVAKNDDGTSVTNTPLEFSFEGNKGHDYEDGREKKKAKFVVPNGNGGYDLVETMTASTDQFGKVSVHVLSSDIISGDIEIKVKWRNAQNQLKEVGNKACDFGAAESLRRFPNWIDPEDTSDTGWLFGQKWLNVPSAQTTAKVYMKFMKKDDGDWIEVNGHVMWFEIEKVDTEYSSQGSASKDEYATLLPTRPNGATELTTTGDGAATATVRAESKIGEASVIWMKARDLSQWKN